MDSGSKELPSSSEKIPLLRVLWAKKEHVSALIGIDRRVVGSPRRKFIESSISERECLIAMLDGKPAGFAIFNTGSFFDQTFIWLLVTDTDFRRKGVASALIQRIESLCTHDKLFTSTNQSNVVMHELMRKLGFKRTGVLKDLDPGDPEIFYVKNLSRRK